MTYNLILFFLGLVSAASVAVNLHANWTDSPFEVQLVEAVAGHNETLFHQTVKVLFAEFADDSDWDSAEDENDDFVDMDLGFLLPEIGAEQLPNTHANLYKRVVLQLTKTQAGFLNLNLVNSIYSPRIQAHYDHYSWKIKPDFEGSVKKQCSTDSFGETIDDPLAVWVKYGSRIYCSDSDLYALQLDKTSESTLPFDRIIGENQNAPLLVLYGNPTSERFSGMFSTLHRLAEAGNLQFVWRYVPSDHPLPLEISGYGKTLTVVKKQEGLPKSEIEDLLKLLTNYENTEVYNLAHNQIPHISAMITALVLDTPRSGQFEKLSLLLKNLPFYAPHLVNVREPSNLNTVIENAKANERKGASRDLVGLSINGAMLHRLETDLPNIISKLHSEVRLIEEMEELGFSKLQAKKLFSKFALLSAYKENEYRTGSAQNRYALYKEVFDAKDATSGGVVFFNDLSNDDNYNLYSTDRYKVYIEEAHQFRHGQVPPLKENVHDLIFVLNFSNKGQLKVFFAMSKMILDKGIPQQLGVLSLVETEKDAKITDMFYHIMEVGELTEALAFLYKYLDAKPEDEESLFNLVAYSGEKKHLQYKNTLQKFSINEPSVIINGVIVNMRQSNWQNQMGQQIFHDVQLLQNSIRQGNDQGKLLKDVLYAGSKSFRNLRVTPKDPGNIRYKRITSELLDASVSFKRVVDPSSPSITFWLIGDFNKNIISDQFKQILEFMRQYNGRSSQVRVLNTAKESKVLENLASKFSNTLLTSSMLREMIKTVGDVRIQTFSESDPAKVAILEKNHFQVHQSSLLFNSRQFRLDSLFDVRELQQILQYEFPQRLDTIDEILHAYPGDFAYQSITDFKDESFDDLDWYDMVTSVITESFNLEDSLVRTDVARFDFSSLNFENSIDITGYDDKKPLDILITIDPVDEFSQALVSVVESLVDLPFVNILLLVQPFSVVDDSTKINRFYASGFLKLIPSFSVDGQFFRQNTEEFKNLPKTQFRSNVDVPNRWSIVKNETVDGLDFDNLDLSDEPISADYVLKSLAVEGFVKNVKNAAPVTGLSFVAINDRGSREGFTMETLGYNQLRLEPGVWQFKIKDNEEYELLSADANLYVANDNALDSVSLSVFSLAGNIIQVRTRETSLSGQNLKSVGKPKADINVFSIASGLNYEKLMAIMMLSVKTHTKKTLKFWLLEDFLSQQFKTQLPILAETYDFQYELISYKWPIWLRQQSEAHRIVWAYKILFLDVLFPADLDKVIFVDADQIARTDLYELVNQDLAGAPYGFVPMCDSREDMDGFRFWKQGYWQTVLKDDLKYHISALFVVDLVLFRENAVGDKLRSHYQKLSSDPNSLSNLDQDLPNNLQRQIPIFSLPQEWLWCETWCSQALKKSAKMIDLCNDPTSQESKIARAIRLIPEWSVYNQKLQELGDGKLEIIHDEL